MRGAGHLAAAVLTAALTGCAAQQCDPSQAGFLSGLGCEASGSYTARNQQQQSTLAQQNAAALQNRAAAQDEGMRANQAVLTRDQARRRLSAVDQQTSQLRRRLAAARASGTADQGRLAAAQAEYDTLQRQRGALNAGATEDQVRAVEAQRSRFARQLEGL